MLAAPGTSSAAASTVRAALWEKPGGGGEGRSRCRLPPLPRGFSQRAAPDSGGENRIIRSYWNGLSGFQRISMGKHVSLNDVFP